MAFVGVSPSVHTKMEHDQRYERLCLYRKPPLYSPHSPYSHLPFILPGRLQTSSPAPSNTSPLSRPKHPRPAQPRSISPPPLDPRLPPFKATQPPPPQRMRPHPHQKWALQHPPAPKSPLRPTRLHARTAHPPPQARLTDRERQLQEYLGAERPTRGDGSPLHANPQQVFTFSATDEAPANTVLDDVTGFVDPVPGRGREGEGGVVTVKVVAGGEWRRGVDGEHWRMVRGLVGGGRGWVGRRWCGWSGGWIWRRRCGWRGGWRRWGFRGGEGEGVGAAFLGGGFECSGGGVFSFFGRGAMCL